MAKGKTTNEEEISEPGSLSEIVIGDAPDPNLNILEGITDSERIAGEDALLTDEEKTEEEAEEKGEKQKHAIVLTGGIDSTVLLYHLKNKLPNATLVPIVVGDRKYVTPSLNDLKVKSETKLSLPDTAKATDREWDKFFNKLADSKITVIHFGANHDEGLESIRDKNFPFYQRLNDIANRSKVSVSTPFSGVTKDSIIQMGIDEYDIDLGKLAPPKKAKKDDKDSEAYERIRKKGFNRIYSQKYARIIDDPFGPPRRAKESEGG